MGHVHTKWVNHLKQVCEVSINSLQCLPGYQLTYKYLTRISKSIKAHNSAKQKFRVMGHVHTK
jgi:hypothetical protein